MVNCSNPNCPGEVVYLPDEKLYCCNVCGIIYHTTFNDELVMESA